MTTSSRGRSSSGSSRGRRRRGRSSSGSSRGKSSRGKSSRGSNVISSSLSSSNDESSASPPDNMTSSDSNIKDSSASHPDASTKSNQERDAVMNPEAMIVLKDTLKTLLGKLKELEKLNSTMTCKINVLVRACMAHMKSAKTGGT
ncbi:hypothetical protein AALP_AAs71504U000100 [Arabis alpina]|uniref:Uncharacterized protein n=1 Tax=Arabis alpina TaxID=50452 RepID=A0A087FXX7_ARAAL|nr:hypothetical protein AALP_AAs71504U000100 [Arabis alpina]